MRAIRAHYSDLPLYGKIFMEEAGMPIDKYRALCGYKSKEYQAKKVGVQGCTNSLTVLREYLASKGYEKAVESADTRFLIARIDGKLPPQEYNARWLEHIKAIPEDYPEDAL